MLQETQGIVIKTLKYGDTSIISRILTRDLGVQSYMIKGVRSAKAKDKASLYQPPNILDLVVYYRANKNLQHVKEARHEHIYRSLPFDIRKSSIALFIAELLSKTVIEEEKNPPLFEFIRQHLVHLDEQEEVDASFHFHFMLQLSRFLGFYPDAGTFSSQPIFDLREGIFTSEEPSHPDYIERPYSQYIHQLLQSRNMRTDISIPDSHKTPLLDKILLFYSYHVENFGTMKSHRVLNEVLRNG